MLVAIPECVTMFSFPTPHHMQEILHIHLLGLTLILGLDINLVQRRTKRQVMLVVGVEEW